MPGVNVLLVNAVKINGALSQVLEALRGNPHVWGPAVHPPGLEGQPPQPHVNKLQCSLGQRSMHKKHPHDLAPCMRTACRSYFACATRCKTNKISKRQWSQGCPGKCSAVLLLPSAPCNTESLNPRPELALAGRELRVGFRT